MEKVENYKNIYYPPGGILIWIIILLELTTFGIALIALVVSSKSNPQLYHSSRLMLNPTFGVINTLFLLTGGFFMAEAVRQLKNNPTNKAAANTLFAIVSGLAFLGLKSAEYYEKIEHGLGMEYNSFFTFYWLLTGFHVVHVIVGVFILAFMYKGIKSTHSPISIENFEAGAHFWHMVDLIWLLLFPILYLIL